MIKIAILVSCSASFVLILIQKWGISQAYEKTVAMKGIKWLPAEFCYFCAGFWLSVGFTMFWPWATSGEFFALLDCIAIVIIASVLNTIIFR